MLRIMRALGLLAWIGCVVTLIYQTLVWVVTASWPALTLLSLAYDVLGLELASAIQSLPLDVAIKCLYVLATTELAITLWLTGALFFALAAISKVVFGK
ncbi:potassium:proton antiporter [Pseudodesulfovibrio cashew]|uniref:Potassium:proton antiporter n=1 Tax=Pseudodesulfovibrio cashew TaxID=2678688 RepID=A0A6I6JLG2_9BACT|nr:potassium:proton antiporter [Pseudodesulfovibrio cashew]QGY40987.1 potassium:proton antiporter [Pseudodesulfovibrio cashew]